MKWTWNTRWIGAIIGIIGPFIIVYGINIYQYPELGYIEFINHSIAIKTFSTWLKPAVIFNLAPFVLFVNSKNIKIAQGVLLSTILFALYIAYLTFA